MNQKQRILLLIIGLVVSLAPTSRATSQPLIIYSFNFVELSKTTTHSLQAEFEFNSGADQQWQVSKDQELLEYAAGQLQVSARGDRTSSQSQVSYNSWLTAAVNREVVIELAEETVAIDGSDQQVGVTIQLQPTQISKQQNKILTEIKFDYQGRQGERAATTTTSWVGPTAQQPVALVSQRLTGAETSSYRSFILYLRAATVDSKEVDRSSKLIVFGNVRQLGQLFGEQKQSNCSPHHKLLTGYLADEGAEVRFDWRRESWQSRLEVSQVEDQLSYQLGGRYEWGRLENLSLAGRLENQTTVQEQSVLRLGLTDQVSWQDLIQFELNWLPLYYQFNSELETGSLTEVKVEVGPERWQLWYLGRAAADQYSNQVGIRYRFLPQWSLVTNWSAEADHSRSRLYLGLQWKLED